MRLGSKRATEHDKLLVGLGELNRNFRHCNRIGRPRKRGRSLQQRRDAVESGPIQGEGGQPVLRDFEGRTRCPHPLAQIRHFGHCQPVIAGDDDHRRLCENGGEGGYELPLLRTVQIPSPS